MPGQECGATWFQCPGCDRVVTGLVTGNGPSNREYYSRTHCCQCCERGEGHAQDPWGCAGLPGMLFREMTLPGVAAPAHYLLHVPEAPEGAGCQGGLPAVLFLHGGVTYVYPETLWWDVRCLIERNSVVRERFVLVAPFASVSEPLAVVSDRRTKVDRFGNTLAYVDDFEEDLVWSLFLRACMALGPGRVDMSRLFVVGYSMGGQSAWNLMTHYGSRLAGAVPFAGCCSWRGNSWNDEEAIYKELAQLVIRSYNGEADTGTYAWRDFVWLARWRNLDVQPSRRTEARTEQVSLHIQEWSEGLQLCLVNGTASCHCCWDVVLHNEDSFKLFSWLETLRCSTPPCGPEEPFPASRSAPAAGS